MSGVLHPAGPEPEETYWLRRAMVAGAVLVMVILVVALFVNSSSTGTAVATAPTPSPSEPAVAPSRTPGPSASTSTSPSPSPSDATSPSNATSTNNAAPSRASTSAGSTTKPSGKASSTGSRKPEKSAAPAAPASCSPGKLRATLTGDQRLKPKERTTFALSLINGSGTACRVSVSPKTFELKVYSGSDRIWSSDDCDTAVKSIDKLVAAEDAVTWSMAWNGRRSAEGCKNRPEVPRAGTYFATAQLKGADPVQLRLILSD